MTARWTTLSMAFAVLAAWLISWSGWAATGDAPRWDGFEELTTIGGEVGASLQVDSHLRWDDLKPHDIVVIVAPKVGLLAPDRRRLVRFVEAGGRLILADDFGPGASWVEALGVSWRGRADSAGRSLHGLPQFPIYPGALLGKRLGFQVPELVLNRPASFVLGAHVDRDLTVAVDKQRNAAVLWLALLSRGAGRALVIADSSALINEMTRRIHGNRQFAANTLGYFCSKGTKCSLRVLIGVQSVSGVLPQWVGNQGAGDFADTIRRGLDRIFSGIGARWWVVALVILMLGIWTHHEPKVVIIPERDQVEVAPPAHTVQAHLQAGKQDFTGPALHLAAHLGTVMKRRDGTGLDHPVDARVDLSVLRQTLRELMHQGRIGSGAGSRIEQLLTHLQTLDEADADSIDSERFTALAGEIDWAEHVLRHTLVDPTGERP